MSPFWTAVLRRFGVVGIGLCMALHLQASLAQVKLDPAAQYRTVADVLVLLDQIKPDPQRAIAYRALLNKPLPGRDSFWFTKRDALLERMEAAENLGDIRTRLEAADAIMAIFRERKDRQREMEFAISYAGILREAGKTRQAFEIEEEAAIDPKTYVHWVWSYHARRTQQLALVGDVPAAAAHYNAVFTEYQLRNYHLAPNTASGYYYTTAIMKQAQGRYLEAQANFELALAETSRWVKDVGSVAGPARHALPANRGYAAYLAYRAGYIRFLLDQGKLAEAERVAREPLLWSLERMGKYSHHAVQAAGLYAEVLSGQGRHVEAEMLSRAALEMAQGIGADAQSSFVREAHFALGRALLGQGQAARADAIFVAAETAMNNQVGVAAVLAGRASAVLGPLKLLAERAVQNVGPNHPVTGDARGIYAMALAATGSPLAGAEFEAALPGLLAARQQLGEAEESLRVRTRQWILEAYLQHLGRQSPADPDAAARGFLLADLLRGSSTQQAVAASAARAGVRDPALAGAVRREQDLRIEMVASFRALQRLATLSPDQLAEQKENPAVLRERIAAISREHSQLFADIERRFPKYANLINPQPPSLQEARAVLRQGEVLVSVLTTPRRSYVWTVPHTGAVVFHSTEFGEDAIAPLVKRLRAALDVGDLPPNQWPVFDVAAAHRLYSELLGPSMALLAGADTLLLAAGSSLAGLPAAVLVSEPHQLAQDTALPFDRYGDVPWLGRRIATAQLPSVNALVLLRSAAPGASGRMAFVGFADPVFAHNAAPASSLRSAVRNAPTGRVTEQAVRGATRQSWIPYSRLPPLPETRDEVVAIALALGADPVKDVVLGAQVTRQRVMQMNLSATRVVAFATHGLVPGDFPGLSQPALALSAPAGTDADRQPLEALLTLEDVLQLKLDADWVVLSACNTAAADGLGGEAVSGLGRGFFYAGSRALLVTHWSVDSQSAKDLVTGVFRAYTADPALTRAKALHRAMDQLRNSSAKDAAGKPAYALAHPLFWAPYALVGEPGR